MDFRVAWHLPTRHVGREIVVYYSISSTSDVALHYPVGTAILADEQTEGRGQFGRSWSSPPRTSVLLSVTIDPPPEFRRPVILTAWAAVAVAETVRQCTGAAPRIKWPNDVLLAGKKIAGILIEQKAVVVAGIGLNVSQTTEQFEAAELPDAGSLASVTNQPFDRDEVARRLIVQLDAEYSAIISGTVTELESRWANFLVLLGDPVELETIDERSQSGRLVELTFDRVTLEIEGGSPVSFPPESIRHIR